VTKAWSDVKLKLSK